MLTAILLIADGKEDTVKSTIEKESDSTDVTGFVDLILNLYSPAAVPSGIKPFISGV